MNLCAQLESLSLRTAFKWHDYQQIHIGIFVWLTISIRPKQNDLLRTHRAHNLLAQIFNVFFDLFVAAFNPKTAEACSVLHHSIHI